MVEMPHVDQAVEFERLAALTPVEYDQQRDSAASALGIRKTTLDTEVISRRPKRRTEEVGNGFDLADVDPWPEEVDGPELLDALTAGISRYVVTPKGCAEIAALWILHAHLHECFRHTPRLAITAAARNCGKTTLLDVLGCMVPRTCQSENMSTAVLFRAIDKYHPTVLLDEADVQLRENEELRACVNSGHKFGGAHHRCEGDNNDIKAFQTFAPMAIAGIGNLPATVASRSIHIELQRKTPDEEVMNFRDDRAHELRDLNRMAARWAEDHAESIRNADPDLPDILQNRTADNWRVLIAIADHAGGEWPELARTIAARQVSTGQDDSSRDELMLRDIKDIFDDKGAEHPVPHERMTSEELTSRLVAMEDRPWPEYSRGKPLTKQTLSRRLKNFHVSSKSIRVDGHSGTPKGYERAAFEDAWARYCPPPPCKLATTPQPTDTNGYSENKLATEATVVAFPNGPKPTDTNGCGVLRLENSQNSGNSENCLHCHRPIGPETSARTVFPSDGPSGRVHKECFDLFCGDGP